MKINISEIFHDNNIMFCVIGTRKAQKIFKLDNTSNLTSRNLFLDIYF